jgi:plasmid stabilization system protein ParE
MAYEIIVTDHFEETVAQTANWLQYRWSADSALKFQSKLLSIVVKISNRPGIGRVSLKDKTVRSVLVTKHNRLYYSISGNSIILLELFETKQNPRRNKFE